MKTAEPVLVRGRDTWDEVQLPEREFDDRITRLREGMATDDVDVLVIYARGERDGHLTYVSNLVNKVPGYGRIFVLTDTSAAFCTERTSRNRPIVEDRTWVDDIRFTDDVTAELGDVLDELSTPALAVGTAGFESMTHETRAAVDDHLSDHSVTKLDGLLLELRQHKSARERDQVERASRVLTDVHSFLETELSAPTDERAVATTADRIARLRGVQDFRVLVSNPSKTEPELRPPENHAVSAGDELVLYMAARYGGYWAEIIRTVSMGREAPAQSEVGDASNAYETLLSRCTAGTTVARVREAVSEALGGTGLETIPHHRLGNGIGVSRAEKPYFGEPGDFELEAGMCMAVRLPLRRDGGYPLFVGDTIEITRDEPSVLTAGNTR